jgi:hypothetical protein
MFYHNTLIHYYYFDIMMIIESEGSESSEGFE